MPESAVRFRRTDFLGFPKYEVGTDGSVWTLQGRKPRKLKPAPHSCGYLRVVLSSQRVKKTISVHTLVLLAFVGPCPVGMECRHENGNRHDNHLTNLSWGTALENAADRSRHGNTQVGEKHWKARLTAPDILSIRQAFSGGETKASIARRFKMSRCTINDITRRRSWRHLADQVVPQSATIGPGVVESPTE